MFKKLKIYHYMILITLISVIISLIVSTVFVQNKFSDFNVYKIKKDISRIAKQMATEDSIIENLKKGNSEEIDRYTSQIAQAAEVDFIVVIDTEGLRLSHPDKASIGKPFSNQGEIKRTLNGESYFSIQVGVLGKGSRYFTPIYDKSNKVIGVVCVGIIDKNIKSLQKSLTSPLLYGSLIGAAVGLIMTLILSFRLKKATLGLEPAELGLKYIEKDLINDEVNDGIIALSANNEIMLINSSFKKIFPNSFHWVGKQRYLNPEIKEVIFQDVFVEKLKIKEELIYFSGLELLVNVSPIFRDNQFIGAVATIKDQSEFKQLMFELSGTEKYVGALRAQTHEFMNKLHIISGLIELERYDEVETYISSIQKNHEAKIGQLNLSIKNPIMLGFLIGKINEGSEKHIQIKLTENSSIPDLYLGSSGYSFLQVLGNLIDNAIEAIASNNQDNGRILIDLTFEVASQTLFATVANNGPEIDVEIKDLIFNENISTKGRSNGYGLYICKGIVDSQNGEITMTSSQYETVFHVEFPLGGEVND